MIVKELKALLNKFDDTQQVIISNYKIQNDDPILLEINGIEELKIPESFEPLQIIKVACIHHGK